MRSPYCVVRSPVRDRGVDYQDPIQDLASYAADPAFHDRVHARGPHRSLDDPDAQLRKTASNATTNLESRSRMRNLIVSACPSRSITRFRACWATHVAVGLVVAPRMWMRRVACSMTARQYTWAPFSRSTVKKSVAMIASAWDRENCAQVGPVRRGPGSGESCLGIQENPRRTRRPRRSIPALVRISHTVEAAIRWPDVGQDGGRRVE